MRPTADDFKRLGLMLGAGLLVAAGLLVLFFAGGLALLASTDMCGNDVVAETPSHAGTSRAVIFRRGCGATTPWSTHASVLGPAEHIHESDDVGNAVRVSPPEGYDPEFPRAAHGGPELSAVWRSDSVLELYHRRGARISRPVTHVGRVRVVHVDLPDRLPN